MVETTAELIQRRDAEGVSGLAQWFALRTAPRHEKRVHERLCGQGVESFLPLCEQLSQWKDRRKRFAVPLFPGDSFARFTRSGRLVVVKTPGIAGIVGAGGTPEPVDEREIASLKKLVESRLPYAPSLRLRPGMAVEVIRGPLTGVRGVLIRTDERYRLVISVNVIRQGAAVEIDAADVATV